MYRAPVNYLPHLMFGFQRSCVTKVSDERVSGYMLRSAGGSHTGGWPAFRSKPEQALEVLPSIYLVYTPPSQPVTHLCVLIKSF